jgi:type IV pilus assembly protein PilX
MQKMTSIVNNQQGSVIVLAMVILVLLTIIGIAATNTSTTEVQISTNALLHNIAFYTADSGIEAGRAALNNIKIEDAGSWDKLLFNIDAADEDKESIQVGGLDCVPNPCWTLDDIIDQIDPDGRRVGPATYTLSIGDNDDLDGNDEVDSDNTIFLTSTLVSPYRNATATISTTVRGGGEAYSQEHYDAGSTGEAALESETASANVRW